MPPINSRGRNPLTGPPIAIDNPNDLGLGLGLNTPEAPWTVTDPSLHPDWVYGGYKELDNAGRQPGFGRTTAKFVGGGGTGGGGGGILPGAPPRGYNPASGGIPQVTNPIDVVLGNMGGITGIQTGLTDNALQLLRNQYGPGYFAALQTMLENTDRRAHGDISDLLPGLWQNAAESAVAGGYSGSGMEASKRLRDMGLTRYKVENDALDSLAKIYGMTPTVKPQDMSDIIAAIIAAQERADLYRSAPVPEAAYNRAKNNIGGAGGGGGTGGIRYGSGGGGASAVDDILKRYGATSMTPVIGTGTAAPTHGYSTPPYGVGAGANVITPDTEFGPMNVDFGGGLNYQGQVPSDVWSSAYDVPTGFGGSNDYGGGTFSGPMFDVWNTGGYTTDPTVLINPPPVPPEDRVTNFYDTDPFSQPWSYGMM